MKISFTGDIIFSGSFDKLECSKECIDESIVSFLSDSDTCVCDIEGPIYSGPVRNDKVAHRNTPNITEFTSDISGNVWYIGNNHLLDYDYAGLNETIKVANENGIRFFGAGRNIDEASSPVFFGTVCGIIGVRYHNMHGRATKNEGGSFIWDEKDLIRERINEIKTKCKWCIIVSHGGDEFCDIPLPKVRERYLEYLEWGADIVVGHHPHVVQNYECVGDKIIFYSIGNFLFGTDFESIHESANVGILIKINLDEHCYDWSYLPIQIDHDKAKVVTTRKPNIFRNIDCNTYFKLMPIAAREYICQTEIKNIKYNIKRQDISVLAKTKIILSHAKKNIKMRKKYKVILKTADRKKRLDQLLSSDI